MERPKAPHQEVTSPENAEIHGNLRDRTWGGLQTLRARAELLAAAAEAGVSEPATKGLIGKAGSLLEEFNRGLIRTSGSIDGAHRHDTTQAVQGQKPAGVPLVGLAPPAEANGHANGHVKAVKF